MTTASATESKPAGSTPVSSQAISSSPALDPVSVATAQSLRDAALAGSGAFAIVQSLTTEVGARLAGGEADARAVEWAKARFAQLGFDRVILQPVTFPIWQRRSESARVLPPYAQTLHVTALGGSVGTDGELAAEVVEFSDLAALRAVPAGSLTGKIAYIAFRMPRFRDGRGYGLAVAARSEGASDASRAGAMALLIRSIGTDSHRFPHTGNMRYAEGVKSIPAAALSNPDADQLSRLLALGKPVRVSLNLDVGVAQNYTSFNVIGEITGSELPQEFVVIGGHLDSWDLGTGAIDDGAGVAITMEAGARIAALPTRPRRSIRVVAFANEEQGLFGAKQYAQANRVADHLIGAESDFGAGRIYALRAKVGEGSWPVIEQIGAVLAPLGIVLEREGGGPGPDISPLVALGMPWAQLAQDGSDYFDYHHTADDTLDKIDPKALDQQVAAYVAFAWLAADMEGDFGRLPPPTPKP
ncbi:MAG: M20/M25/M40 family metallo-hydrolase [Pseudomarimonas sp.]